MAKMNKYTAEKILNLTGSYAETDLRTAYRHAIKNNHPDRVIAAGGDPDAANAKMADINAAHDYLASVFESTGATRLECSLEEPLNYAASEPAPAPKPDIHPTVVENEILDPAGVARVREAYAAADNLRAQADAREDMMSREPLWYVFARPIAEHAPYRILFIVAALVFMSCVAGINLFATMGFKPDEWTGEGVNAWAFLFSMVWFLVAFANLIVPFATKPLRKVILAIIESKRISAKKKAADAAAEAVAAGKGF